MNAMQREPAQSKLIKSIGYDAPGQILEVELHSGHVYRYFGVPSGLVEEMGRSESAGRFLLSRIVRKYAARKIEEDEAQTSIE